MKFYKMLINSTILQSVNQFHVNYVPKTPVLIEVVSIFYN